jgi:hypothetical protein
VIPRVWALVGCLGLGGCAGMSWLVDPAYTGQTYGACMIARDYVVTVKVAYANNYVLAHSVTMGSAQPEGRVAGDIFTCQRLAHAMPEEEFDQPVRVGEPATSRAVAGPTPQQIDGSFRECLEARGYTVTRWGVRQ